jgi:microcystin degradation protein MlrC
LCTRLWEIRDDVVATYPDLDQTMDTILRHPERRPFVIGDVGDRVVAGAPGDSTAVLQYLLDHQLTLKAAIPITDPDAVRKAREAGPGAELTLEVGGAFTPSFRPVRLSGRVVRHNVNDSLARIWESKTAGDTVVFQSEDIHLLLSTKSNLVMFPESFTSQGIEIESLDLVVVKSGYHFRIFFGDMATPLCADTPGLTVFRPEEFPFELGRPIYPLDPIRFQPDSPLLFRARSAA